MSSAATASAAAWASGVTGVNACPVFPCNAHGVGDTNIQFVATIELVLNSLPSV